LSFTTYISMLSILKFCRSHLTFDTTTQSQILLCLILILTFSSFFYLFLSLHGELLHTNTYLYNCESFQLSLKFLLPLFSLGITTMVAWFKLNELAIVVSSFIFGDYLDVSGRVFDKYGGKFKILRID
jgi:hypothetical protein